MVVGLRVHKHEAGRGLEAKNPKQSHCGSVLGLLCETEVEGGVGRCMRPWYFRVAEIPFYIEILHWFLNSLMKTTKLSCTVSKTLSHNI